jgi:hypothetical protein
VEAGDDAVNPWGALDALFIGRGDEMWGWGRQDGGGLWVASMDSVTGGNEAQVPLPGRGGGSGLEK